MRSFPLMLLIIVSKMPPKLVQELPGHSTMDMTMDVYTRADESHQRKMMDGFDDFLNGNP